MTVLELATTRGLGLVLQIMRGLKKMVERAPLKNRTQ
jgi:hypothetical protein